MHTLTNWTYHPADPLMTEDASGQEAPCNFDAAGNQRMIYVITGPSTYTWDPENLLHEIALPDGTRSTIGYLADGRRYKLWDQDADLRMRWDTEGTSGYQDLLQENSAS